MDPARKRIIRLVVALSAAVLLATALIFTAFHTGDETVNPSQLAKVAQPGRSYQLTGTVVKHSVHRVGAVLHFSVADRAGETDAVPVSYTGIVPNPFHEGREIIVTVQKEGDRYVGEKNSLITKCPSKYNVAPPSENQNA